VNTQSNMSKSNDNAHVCCQFTFSTGTQCRSTAKDGSRFCIHHVCFKCDEQQERSKYGDSLPYCFEHSLLVADDDYKKVCNEMKGKASCKQENCRGIITVTESVEDNGYIEWREIRYSMCPSCGEKGYVVEKSVW